MFDDADPSRSPLSYAPRAYRDQAEPLTAYSLASVSVRLLGIYCFIRAIPALYRIFEIAYLLFQRGGSGGAYAQWSASLAFYGVYIAAGLVLILWTRPIARRIVPAEPATQKSQLRSSNRSIQSIAFSVLGVIFCVFGVGEMLQALVEGLVYVQATQQDVIKWLVENRASFFAMAVFKAGAGGWLFFGAKRLTARWRRARAADRQPDDVDPNRMPT